VIKSPTGTFLWVNLVPSHLKHFLKSSGTLSWHSSQNLACTYSPVEISDLKDASVDGLAATVVFIDFRFITKLETPNHIAA
jgi:hypothetical protein